VRVPLSLACGASGRTTALAREREPAGLFAPETRETYVS
jgi:hypothetical protein